MSITTTLLAAAAAAPFDAEAATKAYLATLQGADQHRMKLNFRMW